MAHRLPFYFLIPAFFITAAFSQIRDAGPAPRAREAYELGLSLRTKGDYNGAIAALNRALKADPNYADSYRQRGLAYNSLTRYKEALSDFDRAIQLDPRDARHYNGRGNVRRNLKDAKGALADISRAIELDPAYSNAVLTRGSLRKESGDPAGAIQDYARAVELDGNNAAAFFNLGMTKIETGDASGGLAALTRALELKIDEPFATTARKQLSSPAAGVANRPGVSTPSATPAGGALPPATVTRTPASTQASLGRLTIPQSQFLEGKWGADTLWKSPSPIPLPDSGSAIPAVLPEDLDINHLSPVNYSAAITAAKEAMRLLMGPVSAEDEKRFETKWAPLYEYPCQPVIEYFNQLNPLLNRFIDTRAAVHAAMIHFNDAWEEAMVAAALGDEDSVREAMEVCRIHRNGIASGNARLAGIARDIEKIGEPPDVLALKGKARRQHAEAMELFGPKPFEGEWRDETGEQFILKVMMELQPGAWLVYNCPVTRIQKSPSNTKWFLKDMLWVMERNSDGAFLLLDWVMVKSAQVFRPDGTTLKITRYTPPNSFNPDKATFGSGTATLLNRVPATTPVPAGQQWAELTAIAQQVAPEKLSQFLKWNTGSPNEYNDALRGTAGLGTKRAEFEAGLQKVKQEVERARAADLAQVESSLRAAAYLAQSSGNPFDMPARRREAIAGIDAKARDYEIKLVNQLRAESGMEPLADPASAPALVSPVTRPNPAVEAIVLCRANQVYFQNQLDRYRADLQSNPADRERINYLIMVTEANLQAERDNEATMTTGEWTRTHTGYDDWNFHYMASHGQQIAAQFSRSLNAQAARDWRRY